jgi:hypothetical protein
VQLLQAMVAVDETALAEQYRAELALPQSVLQVDEEALARAEDERRAAHLSLSEVMHCADRSDGQQPVPLLVDDPAGLADAVAALAGSDIVGVDAEWQPVYEAGQTSPAATLQVCTQHTVPRLQHLSSWAVAFIPCTQHTVPRLQHLSSWAVAFIPSLSAASYIPLFLSRPPNAPSSVDVPPKHTDLNAGR